MQLLARGLCSFFINTLDLAAINAHTLYKLVTGSKISRRLYLLRLFEELRAKLVENRKANNSKESTQYNHSNTAVCKKPTKESNAKAKTAPTKPVKHAALALSSL